MFRVFIYRQNHTLANELISIDIRNSDIMIERPLFWLVVRSMEFSELRTSSTHSQRRLDENWGAAAKCPRNCTTDLYPSGFSPTVSLIESQAKQSAEQYEIWSSANSGSIVSVGKQNNYRTMNGLLEWSSGPRGNTGDDSNFLVYQLISMAPEQLFEPTKFSLFITVPRDFSFVLIEW